MQRVADEGRVVPRAWWYEVRNALLMNERRNRISMQELSDTLAASRALGVLIHDRHDNAQVFSLAREFNLAVYDAAHLVVALWLRMPLATLDPRHESSGTGNRNRHGVGLSLILSLVRSGSP